MATTRSSTSDGRSGASTRRGASVGLLVLLAASCAAACTPTRTVLTGPALGCTAFALRTGEAVLVGRNLDWPVGDGAVLVNPRAARSRAAGESGADWSVRFASVSFNQFGAGRPLGGMNEAGLVVEELSYHPARYPPEDARPVVDELEWIQYQLDRHATVEEVLRHLGELRIRRMLFGLHYLVADRTGAVAVVEFLDGRTVVYAGADLPVPVLANDSYANLLRNLRLHVGFGGDRVAGPGPESPERFVRAATGVARLEERAVPPGALADSAFELLADVGQEDTQWSIVYLPGEGRVLYRVRSVPGIRSITLADHALDCSEPMLGRRLGEGPASRLRPWTATADRRLLHDVRGAMRARMPDAEVPAEVWARLFAGDRRPLCGPADPDPRPLPR